MGYQGAQMLTFQEINLKYGDGIRTELDNVGFPAVLRYLAKRGIPSEQLDDLGIRILPAGELMDMARGVNRISSADDRLAVVFPHFSASGDYINWWSARLVETGLRPAIVSIANLVPAKRGKMFCPPNEAPHAYLVPTLDWSQLKRGDKVYIHESCIKAINGARVGRWSVGLNGVWGWGSKKQQISLVEELRSLPWKALELVPVIVFDSNVEDNWDVKEAMSSLAARLMEICHVQAHSLKLPKGPDGHWGFDDYCMAVGDETALAFLDGETTPVAISGIELMKMQLNNEVCVVESLGRIAVQETGVLMSRSTFTDVNYAHYICLVEDGENKAPKMVNVPRLWLADKRRVVAKELAYEPGGEVICGGNLNLWRGMALEPAAGDVSMWLHLLEFSIEDPSIRQWLVQWMAYPLQNLGAKLKSFVHFYGPPGSGKQAVIHPLMLAYGRNAITIGKDQIDTQFNSVYSHKQLINLDEIHGGNTSSATAVGNRIKRLVTDGSMVVNTKGQPEYVVRNCANLVTTANYSDAIRLDDDDRRAAVIQFGKRGRVLGKEWWIRYFKWLEEDGAAAVYSYLMGVDMEGFQPNDWAPMTETKEVMQEATRRVDEQWVHMLWEDPDSVLPDALKGSLFTAKQLAMLCYADDPKGIDPGRIKSFGIKLESAGFKRLPITKWAGKVERFWVVRERDADWRSDAVLAHNKKYMPKT